jgi:hypothetical protein
MGDLSGTRRDVLRRGAAAIGVATLAGNAGCMGLLGGGSYSSWLPEPGTIGDSDHYRFTKLNMQGLAEDEDELADETDFEGFEDTWAPADVDWDDVSMLLRFEGVSVVQADFETEDIVDDFEDEDYDEEEEYEGYKLLFGPKERSMAAVGDDTLVLAGMSYRGVEDPQDAVEDVIDTENGDEDRYEDDSDDFDEMIDELGDGDIVIGSTMEPADETVDERGQFENQVAEGRVLDVNGDETDGKWVLVFEDEDDVDVDDVEDWVDASQDNGGDFEDWDDVEVSESGRTVVVEAIADTDDI